MPDMKPQKSFLLPASVFTVIFIFFCFVACKKHNKIIAEGKTHQAIVDEIYSRVDSLYSQSSDSAVCYLNCLLHSDSVVNSPFIYYNLIEKYAIVKSYSGDIDSSLYYFTLARDYWKSDTTFLGEKHYGTMLLDIAYNYYQKGELKKAVDLFEEASSFSQKINYYQLFVNVNIHLSSVYEFLGEYEKALECIERGVYLCHQNNDSTSIILALQSYADLYINCGLFDEASEQFNDVLNYQSHSSTYSRFCYFNGKGRMYYLQDDYANARSEFKKALELTDKNDGYSTMIALLNLAETSLLLNDIDSSKFYLGSIGKYHDALNSMPLFMYDYNSLLGEYYCRKGEYRLAENAFAVADSIGEKIDVDKVILKLHEKRKTRFYAATNKFRDAYLQMNKYDSISRLILRENNRRQVAGLKYKFQRDTTIISQRDDLALGKQQIKSYKFRQTAYIICIVVLLTAAFFVILYYRKVSTLNREKELRKIAALKMESIRGRISPHFTFNVLNNIWAIIDDRENAKAKFDNLTTLIRQSLTNTEDLGIPLKNEIDFVKSYIDLQQLMMDNELKIGWNIEPEINLQQLVPGMIIQIPVENAIKHGLAPKKGDKELQISLKTVSGSLRITITDNGIGLQQQVSLSKNTGTGLKVLTGTIHILNQINEKKIVYEMNNRDEKGSTGTKVEITIPLQYNYDLG